MSGASDADVLAHCIEFDHTLITINGKDFRKLCEFPGQLHPGLIIIPSVKTTNQICFIKTPMAWIDQRAPPETPQDWMENQTARRHGTTTGRCTNGGTESKHSSQGSSSVLW